MGEVIVERVEPKPPPPKQVTLGEAGEVYLTITLDSRDNSFEVVLPQGPFYLWSDDDNGRMLIDDIIEAFKTAKEGASNE
jgi:hypothetical protein